MRAPHVVVPAAGSSQRFKEVGYDRPKPLVQFRRGGSSRMAMVSHALRCCPAGWPTTIGCRSEDLAGFYDPMAVHRTNLAIIGLPETRGQADTVRRLLAHVPEEAPVLVVNSDQGFDFDIQVFLNSVRTHGGAPVSCSVLVFPGLGDPRYSYVDELGLFLVAREKRAISPWAIAGAFWFRSCHELQEALYRQELLDVGSGPEPYLSEALGLLPAPRLAVPMRRPDLLSWGTPAELAMDDQVHDLDPDCAEAIGTPWKIQRRDHQR